MTGDINGRINRASKREIMDLLFAFAGRLRQGAAIQRTVGPTAARVHVLRRDRVQGLWLPLAAHLLRAQRKRERPLPASVRTRLRGVARTLAQEDGGSAVRPGLLRDRLRQALLPRYTAL